MNTLSEQERDGLDDVFLSISSTQLSPLKEWLSQSCCYWILHFRGVLHGSLSIKKKKNTLKWSILPKNYKKIEKHR